MYLEVNLDYNKTVNIEVVRKTRSKRISLRVNIYGIYVISPITKTINELRDFINCQKLWISRMVNYYSSLKSKSEFEDVTKGDIFYLGKRYQLKVVKDVYEHVVLSDNLMQVTIHLKDKRKYRRHLMNWYKQETKKILDEKLPSFANRLSVVYEKVSIRNQKSRWGSCSKKRNLNFNLILSSFPQRIVDYLIIHELSHIVELNHSQKFWKIVYSLDKNYKEHKKWLNTYGSLIKI